MQKLSNNDETKNTGIDAGFFFAAELVKARRRQTGDGNGGAVCVCFPKVRTEIYRTESVDGLPETKPVLVSEPVPDVCPDCRKPIIKEQILNRFTDKPDKKDAQKPF